MSGLRLAAVGDIGIVGRLAAGLTTHPSPFPFQFVGDALRDADVAFGNLEIPFSGGAEIVAHESRRFVTPDAAADRLRDAGFHVLSLANNHVMDFGAAGLADTRRLLATRGIEPVGAGVDLEEARRPVILERRGMRAGFLAYCMPCAATAAAGKPGAAPLDLDVVREDVASLRRRVDAVVVSVHFGMMYLEYPTPEDMARARAIVAGGADVVIGHHPHVLQGVERASAGLIAYSLGEFVFDPEAGNYYARVGRERRRRAMIWRAELGGAPPRPLPPIPTETADDLCPRALRGDEAAAALRRIEELSSALLDPALREGFWSYAGRELLAYQLSGLWFDVRRGHVAHLLRRLPRIRPRHLRLVLGYLKSRFAARATISPPRARR